MMRIIRCDRCGAEVTEEKPPNGHGLFNVRGPLPKGWRRVAFPEPDGSAWGRELCPPCVNALRMFLEGDGRVPGLLEAESLAAAEGCTCPKPVEPTPPCQVHSPDDCPFCPQQIDDLNTHIRVEHEDRWPVWAELEGVPEEGEHEHNFGLYGRCSCGSTYEDVMARTAALNAPKVTEHTHDFVGDQDDCTWPGCTLTYGEYRAAEKDARPNLTARAEKIASGNIPVGKTTAPCPKGNDDACPGEYERGQLHEHMRRRHGIIVTQGTRQCPYCTDLYPAPVIGTHIAKEHPGEWQAWVDGGQKLD